MAFFVDEVTGNITTIQGDSGQYIINGLPTDKNYTYYFEIQDSNRRAIGGQIQAYGNRQSSVVFAIPATLTDLLNVPLGEETAEYYFGIKLTYPDEGLEDTLVLGNKNIGDLNIITVHPKTVEGD